MATNRDPEKKSGRKRETQSREGIISGRREWRRVKKVSLKGEILVGESQMQAWCMISCTCKTIKQKWQTNNGKKKEQNGEIMNEI